MSYLKNIKKGTCKNKKNLLQCRVKNLVINAIESDVKVEGLIGKLKTIYNTKDVNFKAISFLKKYSLILHPLFPYKLEPVIVFNEKLNKITNQGENKESDFFLLISKLEIILFIIFFILIIVFITLYIYLFKTF